jgi:predicted peptidase
MVTRREVFPLIAGASGLSAAGAAQGAEAKASEPELRRVSYQSARTGKERDYFVYLPRGFRQQKTWPVMLFLHGDGERGDAKGELDYVLAHGPLFEAWCQKRDLPFVIISPQLDKFSRGEIPYIKNRTPAQIPKRLPEGINVRPPASEARLPVPMNGVLSDDKLPDGPQGPVEGWFEMENEVMAMVERTVADFRGDRQRVYLTGLSYGGFGAWYLAARHAGTFAAVAPVVAYGHPDQAEALVKEKLPLWVFAGGRDPAVALRYFYPVMNKLEALGHPDPRFTIAEDLGHFTWVRVYEGQDLYDWMLRQKKA